MTTFWITTVICFLIVGLISVCTALYSQLCIRVRLEDALSASAKRNLDLTDKVHVKAKEVLDLARERASLIHQCHVLGEGKLSTLQDVQALIVELFESRQRIDEERRNLAGYVATMVEEGKFLKVERDEALAEVAAARQFAETVILTIKTSVESLQSLSDDYRALQEGGQDQETPTV